MLADLEADRTRIADLEAQILHPSPERSISALRKEITLVQERLDFYRYPVLELPNEIVSDIFMHFLPPYPLCSPLTGLLSPTLLTQICRRWREIALGIPALWRAISSRDISHIPLKQHPHIFDLWLKRSRPCPLSLRIEDEMGVAAILATAVPHCARWEHLVLYLPPFHLPIINGPMPLLRHLDLQFWERPATDVLATFRDVPLLRSVILNDVSLHVILPWTQLTSLTLLYVYPRECVSVLQKTANLVHCELGVCFDRGTDEPGPDITLPYLESLVISGLDDSVTDLLGTFIVPALRSLKIPELFIDPNPVESLTGFISKSSCQLEEVHITGPHSLPMQSYREAFPSIRMFSFDDERF